MTDDNKVTVTEETALVSWSLLITAVVAGIILGQHFVNHNREEDGNALPTTIDQLRQELKQEKTDKEDALKRLSAIMSSRLRDGNPNVVDLSDQNRPMKVGEQFSELYDNQWTDAYSAVENHFKQNEPKIIAFLLGILEQCFNTCQNKARNQLERLQKGVTNLGTMITKKRTKLPNDLMQRIKEERKHSAADEVPEYTNMVPQLKKFLSSHVRDKTDLLEQSALKDYTQECLRLSWLMVIQDPPMTMVLKSEVKAIDNFKVYKHRGNRVDFIVWPALLLQEGGQLISKGVAEFRK